MNNKITFTLLIAFLLGLVIACNQPAATNPTVGTDEKPAQDSSKATSAAVQQTKDSQADWLSLFTPLEEFPANITSSYKDQEQSHPMDGKAIPEHMRSKIQKFIAAEYDLPAEEVPVYAVYRIALEGAKTAVMVRLVPEAAFQSVFYLLVVNTEEEHLTDKLLLADLQLSGGSDASETITTITQIDAQSYQLAVLSRSSELNEGVRDDYEDVVGYTLDANGVEEIKE